MDVAVWAGIAVTGSLGAAALTVSILAYRRQGAAVQAAELSAQSAKRVADRSEVAWAIRGAAGRAIGTHRLINVGRDTAWDIWVEVHADRTDLTGPVHIDEVGPGSLALTFLAFQGWQGRNAEIVVTWLPHRDGTGERQRWRWEL